MSADKPNHATVSVESDGTIKCTPDPVPARGKDVHITFDLTGSSHVFADTDAIVVTDPGDQFPQRSQTEAGGKKAKLFDKNSRRGLFKYTVRLQDAATGEIVELDPGINNEE